MTPDVVLLDLGGVLVELSGVDDLANMLGGVDEAELWRTWLGSEAVRRYERGESETTAFARELVTELRLPIAPDAFAQRFARWPDRLFPGALELIADLRKLLPVACLSNTNALHWDGPMRAFGLHDAFDHAFLSHRMGCLKPDREVYLQVLDQLALAADRVLFLDDNQINVDGARAVGMRAECVKSPTDARRALRASRVL